MKLRAGLNLGEKGGKRKEKDEGHYSMEPYRLNIKNIFDIFTSIEVKSLPPPCVFLHAPKDDKILLLNLELAWIY